jgi:hypothetical protein
MIGIFKCELSGNGRKFVKKVIDPLLTDCDDELSTQNSENDASNQKNKDTKKTKKAKRKI